MLYMVVALYMALVPYVAALGGKLGGLFERSVVWYIYNGDATKAALCTLAV
jgi:hypothetical protein